MDSVNGGSASNQETQISDPIKTDIQPENNPLDDYKKDMFKFKNKFKDSESENEALKNRLNDYELQDKQRKGNYQEVIDDLKTQLDSTRKENKSKDLQFAQTRVKNAIETYAKDQGCKDASAFIKLLGDGYLSTVNLDKESLEPNIEDVKMVVESGIKKYEHLGIFGKSVNIIDGPPNNKIMTMPEKSITNMSAAELEALIKSRYK